LTNKLHNANTDSVSFAKTVLATREICKKNCRGITPLNGSSYSLKSEKTLTIYIPINSGFDSSLCLLHRISERMDDSNYGCSTNVGHRNMADWL